MNTKPLWKQVGQKLTVFFITILTIFSFALPASAQSVIPGALEYILIANQNKADQLRTVTGYRVIDGDTVELQLDTGERFSARLLLIDTPERGEVYYEAATNRLNEILRSAKSIQIEYEGNRMDNYDRHLVHLWADGVLVQETLVTEGYAIARYIHDYLPNSKYANVIYASQLYAQHETLGVWAHAPQSFKDKAEYPSGNEPYTFLSIVDESVGSPSVSSTSVSSSDQRFNRDTLYVDAQGNGLIKGSSNWIHHVPGTRYYDQTTSPQRMFKTIREAESAGYRAPEYMTNSIY